MQPRDLDKYHYVEKTPTFFIRALYVLGILVWIPIAINLILAARTDYFFLLIVLPATIIFTLHYIGSFSLALFYKKFDLGGHKNFVSQYWKINSEPSVDVYLPICGEDLEVLENTWRNVLKMKYSNMKVYVLDDSKEDCDKHRSLAEHLGIFHIERPNKGEMKKAGNLKYAYSKTEGSIIAILDADFAPHEDFLRELVPYMSKEKNGIIQSPQYFPTTKKIHDTGPLAYGGARAQEVFYRIIQVARDRLGGAHCCGTCALYRRNALASIGGFVQMGHSEDAHTGFTLTANGWNIQYIPIILSVGASPENAHAFFHQQHRWCLGNILMMVDMKFWKAKIPWKIKYSYITGFLFYVHQPLLVLISFQLYWIIFFYNSSISFAAGYIFYPHIIWSLIFMFFLHIAVFQWGYLYAINMRMYSYCHAIASVILGKSVGWIPTNAKHTGVSAAFKQTTLMVYLYVLANVALISLAFKEGIFHFFNLNYLSIQFWIFYNTMLSVLVLWHLYKTTAQARKNAQLVPAPKGIDLWNLKMIGFSTAIAAVLSGLMIYLPITLPSLEKPVALPVRQVATSVLSVAPTPYRFEIEIGPGSEGEEVLMLQRYLNNHGYVLTTEGPGSDGNETDFFGNLTYVALTRFQEKNHIIGQGYLNQQTRALINWQ